MEEQNTQQNQSQTQTNSANMQSSQSQSGNNEPGKFMRRLQEYRRVLKVTKKPNKREFWSVVKVTGLGILIIGLMGFLVLSVKIVLKGIFV